MNHQHDPPPPSTARAIHLRPVVIDGRLHVVYPSGASVAFSRRTMRSEKGEVLDAGVWVTRVKEPVE